MGSKDKQKASFGEHHTQLVGESADLQRLKVQAAVSACKAHPRVYAISVPYPLRRLVSAAFQGPYHTTICWMFGHRFTIHCHLRLPRAT